MRGELATALIRNSQSFAATMDISKHNQIALLEDFLPTKSLSALNINETYKVTNLKQVKTKFGLKAVASLNVNCQVFLPKRISEAFEKDQSLFDQMAHTAAQGELIMTYLGGGVKKNQIEFIVGNKYSVK